ncbi:hypothetical protein ACXM5X_31660 [Pseudomonas saponiphila]
MNVFLHLAGGFALKLRTIVFILTGLFTFFFIAIGHEMIGALMIYNHKFLISFAPMLAGFCFLYFGHFLKKMEGE